MPEDATQAKTSDLDKVAINVASHKTLLLILKENPDIAEIMQNSNNDVEALVGVKAWAVKLLENSKTALQYYHDQTKARNNILALSWQDYGVIRILDYIENAGREFEDQNLHGEIAVTNPIKMLWLAVKHGTGGAKQFFFEDLLQLLRQATGRKENKLPSKERVLEWMSRWPDGLDPRIVVLRNENKERIINKIIDRIDGGDVTSSRYKFKQDIGCAEKYKLVNTWWEDYRFHLGFAVRSPDALNDMLGLSLDPDTMKQLKRAEKEGIPFFINPYYLSLLHVRVPYFAVGADMAIRDYVIYSQKLIDEFGRIVAWEKEDVVEPGKPNAAGWLLPTHKNVHRRYPEVAILIPDTVGRACGGLCQSCQRMYDFQSGHLNFDLTKLEPKKSWRDKLKQIMEYYENDSQLRDILITGGDALMSSDDSLEEVLDAIYEMAKRKRESNKTKGNGEKYAEIIRVRLGTRLPVYLPQRITKKLLEVLKRFKIKASDAGVKQFIVQTHFISPMEITPEAKAGISRLMDAGWTVTNQHVLTTSASRHGHTARLRQVLCDIGVLPYYTFTVKGFMENQHNFATNARAVQEQVEEKFVGRIPEKYYEEIRDLSQRTEVMLEKINEIRRDGGLPFLATDRNILNLPGLGKSMSFKVIGITRYGRRILEFDHDATRNHSPVVNEIGKIIVIESKSISEYLIHLEELGEDVSEYESIWGYSMGTTEPRMPMYEYPGYDFKITSEFTNLEI
ncbi:MAG TPA: KamA family protein [Nitrospinota bacterium]|nr:KamA family protein [Nitrospinota bacterium]|tara:strand:+ start:5624 stop:7828 length:2205 start_codon:yes stop_codon:yes gene_type:complete